MDRADLEYLCKVIGNLAGIPIRIYENKSPVFFYSVTSFPSDPIKPYVDRVFLISESIGYFITPYFNYYGVVRSENKTIVIGPSRQTSMSERDIRELALACDVAAEDINDFSAAMRTIIEMPLGSILQILCTMNFVLNGEKLSMDAAKIYDFDEMAAATDMSAGAAEIDPVSSRDIHNALSGEEILMKLISEGDASVMDEWLSHAPSVRLSPIANDTLRESKNAFVATATLASRAAIKGGLDASIALSLSDDYIKKCEFLSDTAAILRLRRTMMVDLCNRVSRIRNGDFSSSLVIQIRGYVQSNISRPISVEELADALFISRTYLSAKFKKETGIALSEFIMREKIEEAKRLLRYSDKSLSLISDYLAFSSQSHLTRAFRKYTGMTPKKYRDLNI